MTFVDNLLSKNKNIFVYPADCGSVSDFDERATARHKIMRVLESTVQMLVSGNLGGAHRT